MKSKVLPYRCYSQSCREDASRDNGNGDGTNIIQYFEVSADNPPEVLLEETCPYCKDKGFFRAATVIHFVSEDAPIPAFNGSEQSFQQHKQFGFLCEQSHNGFQQPKTPFYPKDFSNYLPAVTCFDCLQAVGARLRNTRMEIQNGK